MIRKQLLSVILSVILASGVMPVATIPVQAEESTATSGQCGYSAYWNLSDDGTLSITGSGNLYLTDVPWANSNESITKVVMDNGITQLPGNAFLNCVHLKDVQLSSALTEIPDSCFYGCESLERITLPDSVHSVGRNAFSGCDALTSISIPSSVTEIKSWAFANCKSLQNIALPDSIKEILGWTFSNCTKLTTISVPESLEYIRMNAFQGCQGLKNLDFSNTSLSIIDESAFDNCTALSSIILPQTVVGVEKSAFSRCNALHSVIFHGSPRQFQRISIAADNDPLTKSEITYDYTAADGISLSETSLVINTNYSERVNLTATLTPNDVTDPYVAWTVEPKGVVNITKVQSNDSRTVRVDPQKEGTATITATTIDKDRKDLSATCTVTVESNENYATVYFAYTDLDPQTVKKGSTISRPQDPTQDGYTFLGWSTNRRSETADFSFDTKITNDITLYPIWKDNMISVDFEMYGGSISAEFGIPTQRIKSGEKAVKPAQDPVWQNHTFLGWTANRDLSGTIEDGAAWEEFDFNTPITENITLYAVYTNSTYNVYFNPDGGTVNGRDYYSTDVAKNTTLTNIPTPVRNGYTFAGWYDESTDPWTLFDKSKPVTEDLNLFALWRSDTVTIHSILTCFQPDFGLISKDYQTLETGRNDKISMDTPIQKGYTFLKWTVQYQDKDDNSLLYDYDFNKTVGENIEAIQALTKRPYDYENNFDLRGEMSANSVKVTYHLNGVDGKDVLTTKTVKYNTDVDKDIYPSVPGYAFLGWYTDKECTTKNIDWDTVDDSIDLYAGWLKFADYSTTSSSGSTTINKIYNVTIAATQSENGKTEVKEGKDKGTITITTAPSAGYEVDKVRVIGDDGKEISVKKTGENTYSFVIPDGNAAVVTTYKKKAMPFTDVSEKAYYAKPVEWAVKNNITAGTSATTFSPNDPCKRCEMVMFLWRLSGSPKVSGSIPFKDVPDNAYYKDALIWAVQSHITSGTSATTFSPSDTCKRGQMAMFLWRLKGSPEAVGNPFKDVKDTDYFKTAVAWLKSVGITAGKSKDYYDPNGDCTRGQMVTFLYKYSGK